MAEDSSSTGTPRRPLPASAIAFARSIEPLWVASLAALFVVWGYEWIPRLIRAVGRAGQTETVEWAVYMSLLAGFPIAAVIVALVLPRLRGGQWATVVKGFLVLVALCYAILFAFHGRLGLVAIALIPALIIAAFAFRGRDFSPALRADAAASLGAIVLVGVAAWMSAGSFVYWTRASSWFLASPFRLFAIVLATAIAILGLPDPARDDDATSKSNEGLRVASGVLLAILVAFSFRTNPMVEFYHWGFWVGPIEQLRQGGWLLRDTPSQYGFLSILVPTVLAGSAWQSFWFFQALIYALVGWIMFSTFRKLRPGVGNLIFAFVAVFTALFFRPRTASLILPAQMTPSGGAVRFFWCFVLLAWLLAEYRAREDGRVATSSRLGFPMAGHLVWLCSVAWSFEAAIYCSAIWFAAFAVWLVQRAHAERVAGAGTRTIVIGTLRSIAVPLAMVLALCAVVWAVYVAILGSPPDLRGYIEYGLLYSRGFGALPIATHGAIWYLILAFFIASTVVVHLLVDDWRDFRLVVAAGAWGGIWSLSSYFVSRSHPVNLLSIAPVLLFALAALMLVMKKAPMARWKQYARVAMIPVFAIPMAMTLGHPGLLANLEAPQLMPSHLTRQAPLMDAELESLLRDSGATPNDPVVRIVDGRLLMPAWHGANGKRVLSTKSWLPKPYEIIGTLSPDRRQTYIERNAERHIGGWMVNHQTDTVRWFDDHLQQILRTHEPTRKLTRGPWILWWMSPRDGLTR
ncbi:MAG: hypothetical protein ABI681_01755 [Gemmatimonadales bacterium]